MNISVLVPTYRRPADLEQCLHALAAQTLAPTEIIIVTREDDAASHDVVRKPAFSALPLRTVIVVTPGLVAAMNRGLAAIRTEVVAITDDDAAPYTNWLERIVMHFASSPDVGGVGGRDFLYVGGVLQDGRASVVGKIPTIGKHIGNHHLGYGTFRDVDALKGVNCAYRTAALRPIGFDTQLRGTGAQCHWEISLGIALRRAGWRLIYDPAINVDHFTASRFDEDQRNTFNHLAMRNLAYNETVIRMRHLSPLQRAVFFCWTIFIGTMSTPGVIQALRFLPHQRGLSLLKFAAATRGKIEGLLDLRNHMLVNA